MGQGLDCSMDTCAPSYEERIEARFVRCLVRQAGLVFMGIKPAAVFGLCARPDAAAHVHCSTAWQTCAEKLIVYYAAALAREGVELIWLGRKKNTVMVLVWRPSLVAQELACPARKCLARGFGLSTTSYRRAMSALITRLRAHYAGKQTFPHEVGLVLGYPPQDVAGFISDGGRRAKACGRWQVYGNLAEARRRFAELAQCEHRCNQLYAQGVSLRGLVRLGAASCAA